MQQMQSTTEELIVMYLDGELVRKEMESVLFERLASSPDARLLLREHLVLRGAIHTSSEDTRFQLTNEIDGRTRKRLENILRTVPAVAKPVVVAPTVTMPTLVLKKDRAKSRPVANARPIKSSRTVRPLSIWAKRSPILVLLLLGVIYFTIGQPNAPKQVAQAPQTMQNTKIANGQGNSDQIAQNDASKTSTVNPDQSSSTVNNIQPTNTTAAPQSIAKNVHATVTPQQSVAANVVTSTATPTVAQPQTENPQDIMISRRYASMIRGTKAVTITQRDRM
ncbi:MAG: hypothetical protein ABI444_10090 [Candidatus Kapaibacterium sp.]|jgi:hypothetical protein